MEVSTTSEYCGGAKPNAEILEPLKTPKKYDGTLYVASSTVERSATTEMPLTLVQGVGSLTGLQNGKYIVYQKPFLDVQNIIENIHNDKKLQEEYGTVDLECMKAENYNPLVTFEVNDATTKVKLTPHLKCNPCLPPAP